MIKYRVLKEQKKVIARIDNCQDDVIKYLNKIPSKEGYLKLNWDQLECVKLRGQYKATVICNPGDTFNEEEGKNKARERVVAKYHKDYNRAMNAAIEILESFGNTAKKLRS